MIRDVCDSARIRRRFEYLFDSVSVKRYRPCDLLSLKAMRGEKNVKAVPTINDVAKRAGVSIATVSRVLNRSASVGENLRKKVETAIEETGYRANPIASSLKSARTNQIAIVIPTLRRTYYTDIIKGISDTCYEQGIIPMVLESDGIFEKEKGLIEALERQWVDGIILIPGCMPEKNVLSEYAAYLGNLKKGEVSIPVILVDSPDINPKLDMVCADWEQCFSRITEHLLEIGRRYPAFIGNAEKVPTYALVKQGIDGVLREAGIVMPKEAVMTGNYTVLDGYQAMKKLLAWNSRIDCVICMNDQVAAGAQTACIESGLEVPKDICVIGCGGVAISIVADPAITTVCIPRYEMGKKAMAVLLDRINGGEGETVRMKFSGNLSIRESTMKSARKQMEIQFYESGEHVRK